MINTKLRRGLAASVAGAVAFSVVLTGCQSNRNNTGGSADPNASGDAANSHVNSTFVFATSNDPQGLDPAFANDSETFRITRQIFEGLVGAKPGTADPEPLLAESWEASDEGKTYTFQLKQGVTFQDDTPFNAEAVCFNFDRWYNFTGIAASKAMSTYYNDLFQGFKGDASALYASCEATGEHEAVVKLTRPFTGFISSLSLPAFSMQSPTALQEYDADNVGGSEDAPEYSEYAKGHPVGTGPFVFDSWKPGEETVLKAYEGYWGEQGQVQEIIFRVIKDPTARRQALEAGDVDGYDLVAPSDTAALEQAGYNVLQRPPFTVLYLAFNQEVEQLKDVKVRQAITHAVNREGLASQVLPEGTEVASQFIPPVVTGYNDDVTTYDYDPEKAKELLAEAGYPDGFEITFNYPVDVSRPYMPNPEQIFSALSADLEAVGIKVKPVAEDWGTYINRMKASTDHGVHILGWTGDYNDTDNFVGVFFGTEKVEWGFNNQELFDKLAAARELTDPAEAQEVYAEINEMVAQFLPGVPLAHPAPSLAFSPRVDSYPVSPVNDEVYNEIVLNA